MQHITDRSSLLSKIHFSLFIFRAILSEATILITQDGHHRFERHIPSSFIPLSVSLSLTLTIKYTQDGVSSDIGHSQHYDSPAQSPPQHQRQSKHQYDQRCRTCTDTGERSTARHRCHCYWLSSPITSAPKTVRYTRCSFLPTYRLPCWPGALHGPSPKRFRRSHGDSQCPFYPLVCLTTLRSPSSHQRPISPATSADHSLASSLCSHSCSDKLWSYINSSIHRLTSLADCSLRSPVYLPIEKPHEGHSPKA